MRIQSDVPSDPLKKALAVILEELMANGNNFMEGAALADGRLYKVRVMIKEVVEDGEENPRV